jgi:HK97 family phage prohead protease
MGNTPIRKLFSATVASKGAQFTSTITANTLDLDGEVLMPEGCISSDFERRGTVLWNHDTERPIGRMVGKLRRKAGYIEADTEWSARPAGHPAEAEWFPDTVKHWVETGVVSGVSVTFIPLQSRAANAEDRKTYGDRVQRVYQRWQLIEYSVVPIPSNQQALITAVSKGLISREYAISLGAQFDAPKQTMVVLFVGGHESCDAIGVQVAKAIKRA